MQDEQNEAEREQLQSKLDAEFLMHEENGEQLLNLKEAQRADERKQKQKGSTLQQKFDKFQQKKEVEGAMQVAGELVALQNSKHKELQAIGKAAALVQIGMDTARGAVSAYMGMLKIDPTGISGAIVAAAVTAYGLERANEVRNSFGVGTMKVQSDQLAQVHANEIIIPAKESGGIRNEGGAFMTAETLENLTGNGSNNTQTGGMNINVSYDGATFVGVPNEETLVAISEGISNLIYDNIIPPLPSN